MYKTLVPTTSTVTPTQDDYSIHITPKGRQQNVQMFWDAMYEHANRQELQAFLRNIFGSWVPQDITLSTSYLNRMQPGVRKVLLNKLFHMVQYFFIDEETPIVDYQKFERYLTQHLVSPEHSGLIARKIVMSLSLAGIYKPRKRVHLSD